MGVAGDLVIGHGEQLERIFALQPPAVDRRLPAQQVEAIGDALRQRKPLVIRDADEPLALFDPVLRAGSGLLGGGMGGKAAAVARSEEHTSEIQSLMRSSYAVSYLQQK